VRFELGNAASKFAEVTMFLFLALALSVTKQTGTMMTINMTRAVTATATRQDNTAVNSAETLRTADMVGSGFQQTHDTTVTGTGRAWRHGRLGEVIPSAWHQYHERNQYLEMVRFQWYPSKRRHY